VETLRDIVLITHFIGLAMIIGPFLIQMRAHSGFAFSWVLAGAITQLVSGLVLTWLAEMRLADNDELSLDHTKIAVKLILAVIIFVVALIAYRRQKKVPIGESQRHLLPLLHTSGALAIIDLIVAVIWPGVVR
jgi:peptidoglycan biosynthesis protein MviN/MurJ (putative lipid II flippase)